METQESAQLTYETVLTRVFEDAQRYLGDGVEPEPLHETVDQVVSTLWNDSTRVTTFIPVLAMREIKSRYSSSRGMTER